ncbi:MAG: patatin-like phospholipase family protein [Betaproteobacteria bacterium]|nr:patatin-like phospholipase family protein [Betaproteobacteria bacterium]MCC6249395.1 patatin-like phospholipase family protein [Rubrivivax sp.]MCL4696702.1 patatin-like phospholipase family protein [Burkholderiaceae bacterium]
MHETPLTGLVLSGGGARAAYQVGVLRALAKMRREVLGPRARMANPFGVITGTSAGAINAAALAAHADRFEAAVEVIAKVWQHFSADQVYRADSLGVIRSGAQWLTMLSVGWVIARWRRARPRSLLDNQPLAELLERLVPLERIPFVQEQRQLHALAITASSYTSGEHYTFYSMQRPVETWVRSQRVAVPSAITHRHLLASAAIPFVFPAQHLEVPGDPGWFGDGSMRNTAPLSAAIHLGAERLLIIGAGRMQEPTGRQVVQTGYPNLAQIAGHALASIFLDALAVDVERLKRINRTLALLPESALADTPLRPVEALVIAPSKRLDDIASKHLASLPGPVRALLRGAGVSGEGETARGTALASYLLFEAPFTRELMALGEADTLARRDEVMQFFGWDAAHRALRRAREAARAGERVVDFDISRPMPDFELP